MSGREMKLRGSPAHLHDCEHCRFSWCCGYTCACVFVVRPIPDPPEDIKAKVDKAREQAGLAPLYGAHSLETAKYIMNELKPVLGTHACIACDWIGTIALRHPPSHRPSAGEEGTYCPVCAEPAEPLGDD